jgi:carotenoid cleavage dioxygenase
MATMLEDAVRGVVTKGLETLAEFNRSRMKDRPNPWLTGLNAPLPREITLEDLRVEGTIPPELLGTYVRNGPNPIQPEHAPSYHWFLGDGMVHGVRLEAGRAAWYRNRWVRSNAVSAALGEPPAPGPRHARADNANTNVVALGGRMFAVVEAAANPVELGADLGTVAHNPFDGTLTTPFSAHPHVDPVTGRAHAICYEGAPDGRVWHVVVGPDGRVERTEAVAVADGPSIHDCAITERNILVFDLPVTFSTERFVQGYRFPLGWNDRHPARVGVLGLNAPGASIRWCSVEPCYVFHPGNAFENGDGTITADVVVHNRMFARSTMGPDSRAVPLERWTIDPAAGTVARAVLDAASQEFPRIDERKTGRRHRHLWTVAFDQGDIAGGGKALLWHDLESATKAERHFGEGAAVGEFVHVPRGPGELDAWLMGMVTWAGEDRSALIILDAADFGGPAVATVHIPTRIPPGFHGNWIAG